MGHLNEFSFTVRTFLRAYPWRRINPVPWTPLQKPLSECRLAIVGSHQAPEFMRRVGAKGSQARKISEITGFNFGKPDMHILGIYRGSPPGEAQNSDSGQ